MGYAEHYSKRQTPQTEQAHPAQQQNNAGGFSFVVDDTTRLMRFLVLGSEKGTYYVTEKKLTRDNAKVVERCLAERPLETVELIAHVSETGRAPKNTPAIFALAIACGNEKPEVRKAALAAVPRVCRTGTHLFEFVELVQQMRGWGRGLRKAIGSWYTGKNAEQLTYQLVKYQQRNGWSHRDVLRKAHLSDRTDNASEAALRWAVCGKDGMGERTVKHGSVETIQKDLTRYTPQLISSFEEAKTADVATLVKLILDRGLTREMLPTEMLNHKEVWEALLVNMPMTAMVRNLGKMTSIGLLAPFSEASKTIAERLGDEARIKKARVHPIATLAAMKVYSQGRGVKGKLTWQPDRVVVDALDKAFYLAFGAVEPTGKNHLLALDVSGSMGSPVCGMDFLTCREASAAMALITANVEQNWECVGFTSAGHSRGQYGGMHGGCQTGLSRLTFSPRDRLDSLVNGISRLPFGGTDCSLPMRWATETNAPVDVFCVFTDNETWHGPIHPHQALEQYRQKSGRAAKLVVVGMTATELTIANPNDGGMLDVVGFDTAAPAFIADFVRGD